MTDAPLSLPIAWTRQHARWSTFVLKQPLGEFAFLVIPDSWSAAASSTISSRYDPATSDSRRARRNVARP